MIDGSQCWFMLVWCLLFLHDNVEKHFKSLHSLRLIACKIWLCPAKPSPIDFSSRGLLIEKTSKVKIWTEDLAKVNQATSLTNIKTSKKANTFKRKAAWLLLCGTDSAQQAVAESLADPAKKPASMVFKPKKMGRTALLTSCVLVQFPSPH